MQQQPAQQQPPLPVAPALVQRNELGLMFARCGIDLATSHAYLMDIEGVDSTTSLLLLSSKDIVDMAKRCRFAPVPFAIGAVQQKKLEALRGWVLDYQLCGMNISFLTAASFTPEIMLSYVQKIDAGITTFDAPMPPKFSDDDWPGFDTALDEHLKNKYGASTRRMHYLKRNEAERPTDAVLNMSSKEVVSYWMAPMHGPAFEADNHAAWAILANLTHNTDAGKNIRQFATSSDFVSAYTALRLFYDGPAERSRRVLDATETLKTLKYKGDENTFPFTRFLTNFNELILTLEKGGQFKSDNEKLLLLIDKIDVNNAGFTASIENAATIHPNDFRTAAQALSTSVARNFKRGPNRPKRSIAALESGGGGYDDNGTNDCKFSINGVAFDVKNWDKQMSQDDYAKIPYVVRKMIGYCKGQEDFHPSKSGQRNGKKRAKIAALEAAAARAKTEPPPPTETLKRENEAFDKSGKIGEAGSQFGNKRVSITE